MCKLHLLYIKKFFHLRKTYKLCLFVCTQRNILLCRNFIYVSHDCFQNQSFRLKKVRNYRIKKLNQRSIYDNKQTGNFDKKKVCTD